VLVVVVWDHGNLMALGTGGRGPRLTSLEQDFTRLR
jgi:hypothetical protein